MPNLPTELILDGTIPLDLWYFALAEEHGITFQVPKGMALKVQNKLYRARKEIGDARLDDLSLHINADETTMTIVKSATKDRLP